MSITIDTTNKIKKFNFNKNSEIIKKIKYKELVELVKNESLNPKTKYQIIDYTPGYDKNGCLSNKSINSITQQFDIIVTALSKNTLDNKATTISHFSNPDNYETNLKMSGLDILYDIENNIDKYAWIPYQEKLDPYIIPNAYDLISNTHTKYKFIKNDNANLEYEGIYYYGYINDDSGYTIYTTTPNIEINTPTYVLNIRGGMIEDSYIIEYNNDVQEYKILGTGVIYHMKDHNNNEAPYDFIHLLYDDTPVFGINCKNNKIEEYYNDGKYYINDITFLGQCENNVIKQNCKSILMEAGCCNNIINKNCSLLHLDVVNCNNIFEENCSNITLGANNIGNIFENNCLNIKILYMPTSKPMFNVYNFRIRENCKNIVLNVWEALANVYNVSTDKNLLNGSYTIQKNYMHLGNFEGRCYNYDRIQIVNIEYKGPYEDNVIYLKIESYE